MEKMRLNIQRFSSCSIGTITQSKDIDNNKSTFSIPATLTTTGNTFNNDDAYMTMQWKYESGSWATISKKTFGISTNSSKTKSWTLTLDHKDDGSLEKLNFRVKWYVTNSTNGTSSTKSFTPDDIPRASDIDSITNGTTPYSPTIKWTPKNDTFHYRVYFKNSLGVTVSTGATMYPHQTTQYTYNQLELGNDSFSGVNSAEQTMTAVLETTNYDFEPVGVKTKTFTATLDSSIKPSVSISNLVEADTTMQSLNWGIYVKGKSKLSFTVNYYFPTPVPASATITSSTNSESFSSNATINTSMQTKTFTTSFLKTTGSNTITARVTDSRGRYTDATNQTYTVVDYSEPIITTAEAIRVNSSNVADDEGTYVSYKFVGSISSVSNNNDKLFRIGYRVKGSNTSFTYKTISSGYSVNVTSFTRITDWTLLTTNAYEIVFEAIDSFRTSSNPVKSTRYLDKGFDLMNFNASGKAMAIGKVSEATGNNKLLEVALPTTFTEYVKDELVVESIRSKNMLNLPNGEFSNNGITANINNGTITLSGTATSTSFINIPLLKNIDCIANTNFVISANNSSSVGQTMSGTWAGIRLQTVENDSDTQSLDFHIENNNRILNYSSNKTMKYFTIRTANGLSYSSMTIKPQVETGSAATDYMPYQELNISDTGWVTPTINTNFKPYNDNNNFALKYRKFGPLVCIRGILTPTTTLASNVEQTIFTLPLGYRPQIESKTICQGSGMSRWLLNAHNGGAVTLSRYGVSSQDSVVAGNWLPINAFFFVD